MAWHRLSKSDKRYIAGYGAVIAEKRLQDVVDPDMQLAGYQTALPAWVFDKSIDEEGSGFILTQAAIIHLHRKNRDAAQKMIEEGMDPQGNKVEYDWWPILSDSQRRSVNKMWRRDWARYLDREISKGEEWALLVRDKIVSDPDWPGNA